MPGRRHKAEDIINRLRQADVELGRGKSAPSVCKLIGVTEATYYGWRREYGEMRADQAKRLKELERENARMKRLLVDAELDKDILLEAASEDFQARAVDGSGARTCSSDGPGSWPRARCRSTSAPTTGQS